MFFAVYRRYVGFCLRTRKVDRLDWVFLVLVTFLKIVGREKRVVNIYYGKHFVAIIFAQIHFQSAYSLMRNWINLSLL